MSFKISGLFLIFFSGIYTTMEVKKRYEKRIDNLTVIIGDINFFISQISYLKTPVLEIVNSLVINKEKEFKRFYDALYNYLKTGDFKKLTNDFDLIELYFKKGDKDIILNVFKNIGNCDYENQINTLRAQEEVLKNILIEAKTNKEKNQKSKCTLTMCSFILVIILFL